MISTSYLSFFVVFAFVAYLIATDNSVAQFITLISKIAEVKLRGMRWWLLNNPRNPIVKYLMWRRAYGIARELQEEMERQSRLSDNNSKIVE